MTEYRPREIQLTSKQLVFVFMSTMLVAVVVFLLGVWVGRGIGVDSLAASAEVVDQPTEKAKAPGAAGTNPAPATSRDTLTYPGVLQGSGPPPGAASANQTPPPAPVADSGPATGAPPPAPPSPNPTPPPPTTSQPTSAAKSPPDKDSWLIQVGAYSARSGADKVAAGFKSRGFPTTVTSGPTFKVQLGPYPTRAAADQVAARLRKEGQDLSVIKSR